ncbi:hypothetical protein DSM106972_080260 [Dulcicalothrix desertica PCC 7102]|uniref:DUF1822 domain-containing protein n=1 Tax=Dulcicalothrix desertica PCC 7102 TaxID=232991 RepID=A0A433UXT4_9CYAN|nr:DUF1822 family protein [Dulcicalothrix desertica]RUS98640.1 hypothetical protein DSM106972_080260 [Dulcicalothrix desertica PCC 7102]TWH43145.1 uncharacterized protein DUF1822 [Dulcicalothrix desertica PCC 7102]
MLVINDLILEIPQQAFDEAWDSQVYSNSTARYQAYINELCLSSILPWLQQDNRTQAKVFYNTTASPSFWELVNGTVINVDSMRIVLVPQETIDLSELRVPQEWVDIPGLVGDYYLGVQVIPEDRCIRVWGYCTHLQLKMSGIYDSYTRTYAVDASDVNDINIFTFAISSEFIEPTRAEVSSLPALSTTVAQNLITRLGNSGIVSPRLEIPFQTWGALIENGGWRRSLYQHRIGQPEQSIIEWLRNGVTQAAQQLGWGNLNLQHLGAARSIEQMAPNSILARQLTIAGQIYELRIIPQVNEEYTTWRFELRSGGVGIIPGGFKLRLLTEDLQPFPDNEDIATTATEQLFVEVALEPGEGIVWEIEPVPENYDQEILRF